MRNEKTTGRKDVNPKEKERVRGPSLQHGTPWVKEARKARVLQEMNTSPLRLQEKGKYP